MLDSLIGVFINVIFVVIGSIIGVFFKKGMPERFSDAITNSTGLAVLFIGISGTLKTIVSPSGEVLGADSLILVCSLVLGTAFGTLMDIDGRVNILGKHLEAKFAKNSENSTFAQGFVNATLLFCIGAMAITGPIESALMGKHSILIAKSVLDGISAIIFASGLGIGVLFSAFPIFIYEGGIALIAYFLGASFLTDAMNIQLICVGSLLIVGIGLNMLKITKIKVADMLPAIILAPLFQWLTTLF